ncbi:RRM domain-containing protein [Fusarium falciforme]|uniref:RRM domain-containing protein n=1 Tax=Fusarium falciforme TaxID=195108 RepID=UPI00230087A5|nr:RRM domain-containing protein [Fusarium falciforme]WAO87003.1 RRM domain-containing protein [Fusarium falciforme]
MKSKRAREAAEAEDKHVTPVDVEAPPKKRKRNDDDATTADVKKKAKKEKKDKKHKKESRKERKDKRKDLQDLPEQDDDEEVVDEPAEDSPMADADVKPASATADAAGSDKAAKKKKKKEKKNKDKESQQEEEPTADAEANDESSSKKKKKSKKDKKSSSTTANNDNNDEAVPNGADADTAAADADSKADRHIVFVGNLPFTATADTIQAHFASLSPIHVRCMSDPADSKPCRGFAFVEFAKVWHMRTCLDKFHHSMFEDGVSPARRINVELTAGGGGKTKRRQEKIQEKNRKLDENRTKRIQREKNAKEEARANTDQEQHMEDAIHPSRRGRVPGNAW